MGTRYTRRQAIRSAGCVATLAVAGCLDDNSDDQEPDTDNEERVPEAASGPSRLEIEVIGYQFAWAYEYHSGLHSDDYTVDLGEADDDAALVLPRGERIHLTFTSQDVEHSYGIPGLRVKEDVLPEGQTEALIHPEQPGVFEANCYKLCGRGHSSMNGDVVVTEPDQFREWYLSQDGTEESDLAFMRDDTPA